MKSVVSCIFIVCAMPQVLKCNNRLIDASLAQSSCFIAQITVGIQQADTCPLLETINRDALTFDLLLVTIRYFEKLPLSEMCASTTTKAVYYNMAKGASKSWSIRWPYCRRNNWTAEHRFQPIVGYNQFAIRFQQSIARPQCH